MTTSSPHATSSSSAWWIARSIRSATLTDIYKNGPSAIRSAAVARAVVRILMEHGWVIAGEHPKAKEAFELVEGR